MVTPARRADWWPTRRLPEWLDWLESSGFGERMIRIEERREGDKLVIRAEMPDVDPDKDVTISVRDHTLEIRAERREEQTSEDKGTKRSEFRYGSFFRAVPLPAEAKEGDVQASYKDGVLEVRVPCAPAPEPAPHRIPIARG